MYILGTEGAIRADVLTGSIELQRIGYDMPVRKAGDRRRRWTRRR